MVYNSGSQPGVRGFPRVREISRGVRQIFISLRLLKSKTEIVSKILKRGTRVFYFLLRGTQAKKGLEPLVYSTEGLNTIRLFSTINKYKLTLMRVRQFLFFCLNVISQKLGTATMWNSNLLSHWGRILFYFFQTLVKCDVGK